MSNAMMVVISPVDVMNGPMMLLGSWPLRNSRNVPNSVNGISIKLAMTPAIKGMKMMEGVMSLKTKRLNMNASTPNANDANTARNTDAVTLPRTIFVL